MGSAKLLSVSVLKMKVMVACIGKKVSEVVCDICLEPTRNLCHTKHEGKIHCSHCWRDKIEKESVCEHGVDYSFCLKCQEQASKGDEK